MSLILYKIFFISHFFDELFERIIFIFVKEPRVKETHTLINKADKLFDNLLLLYTSCSTKTKRVKMR